MLAIGDSNDALAGYYLGEKLFSLNENARRISSLAFSVTANESPLLDSDGSVRLWDARNGQPIQILREPSEATCRVVFSPDGQLLATSGGLGGTVSLWDARSGQPIQIFEHSGAVRSGIQPEMSRASRDGR